MQKLKFEMIVEEEDVDMRSSKHHNKVHNKKMVSQNYFESQKNSSPPNLNSIPRTLTTNEMAECHNEHENLLDVRENSDNYMHQMSLLSSQENKEMI